MSAKRIAGQSFFFILISAAVFGIVFLTVSPYLFSQEYQRGGESFSTEAEYLLHDSGVLVFRSGMTIDADGSPHAYSPVPGEGLDFLHNAGAPGEWNGILTVDGKPVLQGPDDPAPGYYISQTALEDKTQPGGTQRRFINAEEIPFISLPGDISGPHLGDVAMVVNVRNGRWSPAILADEGPTTGEGSIALAKALGVNPDPKFGGTPGGVVYVLFERSGTGSAMETNAMLKIIQQKLADPDIQDTLNEAVGSIVDVSAMVQPKDDGVDGSDDLPVTE